MSRRKTPDLACRLAFCAVLLVAASGRAPRPPDILLEMAGEPYQIYMYRVSDARETRITADTANYPLPDGRVVVFREVNMDRGDGTARLCDRAGRLYTLSDPRRRDCVTIEPGARVQQIGRAMVKTTADR